MFLTKKSHGLRSLVGYSPQGRRVGYNWVTKHAGEDSAHDDRIPPEKNPDKRRFKPLPLCLSISQKAHLTTEPRQSRHTGKPEGPFLPRSPLSQFRVHLSPTSLIPQSGSGGWSGRGLRWWHSGTHVWHSQGHCAIGIFRDVMINGTESAHYS